MHEGPPTTPKPEKAEDLFTDEERLALEQLEAPLARVLEELRPEIEKGNYKVIIGDDASGRIPALILGKVLKNIYATQGAEPPLMRFVAGSKEIRNKPDALQSKVSRMEDHFARVRNDADEAEWATTEPDSLIERLKTLVAWRHPESKALVVTDTIYTGASVAVMVEALRRNGIQADVATLAYFDEDEHPLPGLEQVVGARIVNAGIPIAPLIFGKDRLSGVEKNPEDLFAHPLKTAPDAGEHVQETMNAARKEAGSIAERLTAQYLAGPTP